MGELKHINREQIIMNRINTIRRLETECFEKIEEYHSLLDAKSKDTGRVFKLIDDINKLKNVVATSKI